jgi:hypothetical protein
MLEVDPNKKQGLRESFEKEELALKGLPSEQSRNSRSFQMQAEVLLGKTEEHASFGAKGKDPE